MKNWLITFGSSRGNDTLTLDIPAENYEQAKKWAENAKSGLFYFDKILDIKEYDEIERKTETNY